ncbi:YdaS family helix-turn-helix protein [Pseudomonas brenneri]|uniref:YdaS family helix-turn-helix protein n=1 Tax=Pseudomonas brenneri TaxID=129817 RepID=UPI003571325A
MSSIFTRLVSHFGGQGPTATALGVSQGTVSGWVRGLHGCSAEVAILAERKTLGLFSAVSLRPTLAEPSPTMSQTIRPISPPGQSPDGAVNPSSTQQTSP